MSDSFETKNNILIKNRAKFLSSACLNISKIDKTKINQKIKLNKNRYIDYIKKYIRKNHHIPKNDFLPLYRYTKPRIY